RVTATYTVGARPVDDGDASGGGDEGRDYWAVTVAAAVDELGGDRRWHDAGTWYVEVGVVRDADGALVAASEPALVPAPRRPRSGEGHRHRGRPPGRRRRCQRRGRRGPGLLGRHRGGRRGRAGRRQAVARRRHLVRRGRRRARRGRRPGGGERAGAGPGTAQA